ncbi:hypothetical protein GCM10010327_02140 [Streptomyces nitrosporeus]|nr:hypothetical protein GCM10010327_02140 [Streptomyces nitrosporeus]
MAVSCSFLSRLRGRPRVRGGPGPAGTAAGAGRGSARAGEPARGAARGQWGRAASLARRSASQAGKDRGGLRER